jgi:tetratricopeptide (TPR) repeat protein
LALAQAERLDDGPLVVESLCELGNAYRRHGELHRAGEALRAARAQSLLEPLDPLAEAHLHTLLASYFSQRRDYRRALRHCRRALRTYASVGQHNDALTTQIQLAFLLTEGDRAGEGLRVAEAAWSAARVRGHHRAALQAVHNVVYAMVELGENGRALAMLADAAPLYRALAAPRERTLARWLEARAHRGAGDPLRAAGLLRRVCDELAELDLGYELVMCQLHLALACRDAGLWTQLRSTCREAAPLASALGIEDACLAAWRLDSQYGAGG